MIIEIFESVSPARPPEKLLVRLEPAPPGVYLVACDKLGNILPGGYLLFLGSKGFCRQGSVKEDIGLPLDSKGAVTIND